MPTKQLTTTQLDTRRLRSRILSIFAEANAAGVQVNPDGPYEAETHWDVSTGDYGTEIVANAPVCLLGAVNVARMKNGIFYGRNPRRRAARALGITERETRALEAGFCNFEFMDGTTSRRWDEAADRKTLTANEQKLYKLGKRLQVEV